jgi:hypothetical protein
MEIKNRREPQKIEKIDGRAFPAPSAHLNIKESPTRNRHTAFETGLQP